MFLVCMSPSNTQTKSFIRTSHFLTSNTQWSETTKTTLCTMLYSEINKYISVNTDTHTNTKISALLAILLKLNLRTMFSWKLSKKNICSYVSPLLRSLSSVFIHMVTVCSAICEFMCFRWRNTKSHIQFPTHLNKCDINITIDKIHLFYVYQSFWPFPPLEMS